MKYGIWRHENALGNGAEHVINLAKYLLNNVDSDPRIYVENEWQKSMVMCIPGIQPDQIEFFPNLLDMDCSLVGLWKGFDNPTLDDIKMPGVYPFKNVFPAGWNNLTDYPSLCFPKESYKNKHNLPMGAVVITVREKSTYWKRVDGSDGEQNRFVNPHTFHTVALHYANLGYPVVRVGCVKETPFPKHSNILDFALVEDRNLLDDLFLAYYSKIFISCDSGMWPMVAGMRRKLVFTNGVSPSYTNWMPKETTRILYKNGLSDNTFEEVVSATDDLIGA